MSMVEIAAALKEGYGMALKSTMTGLLAALTARDRYKAALEEVVRLTHHQNSHLARQINDVAFKALNAKPDPGIPVYKLEDGTDEFVKK